MKLPDIVVTDLDGTLLNDNKSVSGRDYETLEMLGREGVLRVAATGRSLFAAKQVLTEDFPLDLLIFSTGMGIYDWNEKKLLKKNSFYMRDIEFISSQFVKNEVDFLLFDPLPDNHHFALHRFTQYNPDLDFLIEKYSDFAREFLPSDIYSDSSGHVMGILQKGEASFDSMKDFFSDYNVVRTSSPLLSSQIWMEIFPDNVSKGDAVRDICTLNQLSLNRTLCIGNDYNDLSMLEIAGRSFIPKNSSEGILSDFEICSDNNNSCFSDALDRYRT